MPRAVFPYLLPVMLFMGCTAAKSNGGRSEASLPENLQISSGPQADNKIVFLTIQITRIDSLNDRYRFKVIHTRFAEGQVKKNPMAEFSPEPRYLYCEILDADKKRADYIRVENPLFRVYEFNESPESPLQKKVISSAQGELFLRFQLDKTAKYLSIYKQSPDYKSLKRIYYATI